MKLILTIQLESKNCYRKTPTLTIFGNLWLTGGKSGSGTNQNQHDAHRNQFAHSVMFWVRNNSDLIPTKK